MIKVVIIRHGKTEGNTRKAYIGSTDESLKPKFIEKIDIKKYPLVEKVFSSPLKRCLETAKIIYPLETKLRIKEDLKECDFGDFEGKNYEELKNDSNYIKWLENNGEEKIPNGESRVEFEKRCQLCFEDIIRECLENNIKKIAIICHGGTIMSILHKFVNKSESFYRWQVENLEGYDFKYYSKERKIMDIKEIKN